MEGFRLLAIRIDSNRLGKVIKSGVWYKLFQDFEIDYTNNSVVGIRKDDNADFLSKLYEVELGANKNINISISAIVGENGSGKSSLLELIYLFLYRWSTKTGLLTDLKYTPSTVDEAVSELNSVFDSHFQIIYEYNGVPFQVIIKGNEQLSPEIRQLKLNGKDLESEKEGNELFYSIVSNYSLYGLRDSDHFWVRDLVHKNDGYQTPIVINPYRENNVIDVNSELHLVQSRTLLNLEYSMEAMPGKEVEEISFRIDLTKNDSIKWNGIIERPVSYFINKYEETYDRSILDFYNDIAIALCDFNLDPNEKEVINQIRRTWNGVSFSDRYKWEKEKEHQLVFEHDEHLRIKFEFVKYTIKKIFKICLTYPKFKRFITYETYSPENISFKNLEELPKLLRDDYSHVTLKLRQSIYVVSDSKLTNYKWAQVENLRDPNRFDLKLTLKAKDVLDLIKKATVKYQKSLEKRLEIVPAALTTVELKIKKPNEKGTYSYQELSSGEQQLNNVLHTVYYHLLNLDSVFHGKTGDKKYENILIIFDEVELYYHPEMQRQFISKLRDGLKQLQIDRIKNIHILFATHSPFILSDIPSRNILRLKEGISTADRIIKSFGANITDILADSFFLENNLVGEFATHKIAEVIDWLNKDDKEDAESYKKLIELIDEPIVQRKLAEMYDEKMSTQLQLSVINKQIDFLQSVAKRLNGV